MVLLVRSLAAFLGRSVAKPSFAAHSVGVGIPFSLAALFQQRGMTGAMGDAVIGDGPSMPNVVFVLGAPGSGKGTQCPLIVRDFGYVHLSAGDLLRQERETPDSPFGEMILNHMLQGTIVPVEVTCSLLENAMKKSGKSHFLIDGFPRNENNLEGWERQMGHKTNLQFVLYLTAPRDVCIQRCLVRGASSGRPDDNLESLGKRFDVYENNTLPIIQKFEARGLVRTVSTINPPEEVHKEISGYFRAANESSGQTAKTAL